MFKLISETNLNGKILKIFYKQIIYLKSKLSLPMQRESIYKHHIPTSTPKSRNLKQAYWFVFKSAYEMLVELKNHKAHIPYQKNLEEINISPTRTQYLGTYKGNPCYSAEVSPETMAPEGMVFRDLRSLYEFLDEEIFLLAGKAVQVICWDKDHQYCGRCGAHTETSVYEMAKVCPECGFRSYVRLSPAVITAIIKDGKLLMAKHGYRGDMYGLIAGFVEPGETLEEAVKREIMEEVSLKVKNIEYFSSQSWPFPHSLMIAYTAEYKSGEIQADGKEITEANWFSPDELPRTPSTMSVAGELIQWFINDFQK